MQAMAGEGNLFRRRRPNCEFPLSVLNPTRRLSGFLESPRVSEGQTVHSKSGLHGLPICSGNRNNSSQSMVVFWITSLAFLAPVGPRRLLGRLMSMRACRSCLPYFTRPDQTDLFIRPVEHWMGEVPYVQHPTNHEKFSGFHHRAKLWRAGKGK